MKQADTVHNIIVTHLRSIDNSISVSSPDHCGVWIRGDGARYREFDYIHTTEFTDDAWKVLLTLCTTNPFEVSGELGSDGFHPAIIIKGILFVKGLYRIEFGSPNRLKNSSVWRSRNIT